MASPWLKRAEQLTQVLEWSEGRRRRAEDCLAAEEPLEIRIGRRAIAVTMRTPGHDGELAAGFLFTEGVIGSPSALAGLEWLESRKRGERSGNVICARLAHGASFDPKRLRSNFTANSSCGLCGRTSIDSVRARVLRGPNPHLRVSAEKLCSLPVAARAAQDVFGRTGGLHAAALFTPDGELLVLREDIGRHNAVDKVIGWGVLAERIPLADSVMLVSGRGGFEIVQKAVVAGIPVVASISAPSSLAVELARRMGLTLAGFLRGRRFVIYSGEDRVT